ncbi:LysR family transcriptional regulator [Pedobacter chitinilyticus]|uniref:LysR family transcriptional regulator n=1 Tax=Pedobacter chitinilyticus TaxID=2233776 RepID=A0A3S3Q0P7_9SPHI|nr:LysR family transcriptional regulator [Pedobacter chitinilyticus]RWU10205.1 LysR family transcriptional regulator [Pedobacter chitinilyticus]
MISFNHLVFIEVARHLSFTKASEVLFISQPAISKHIQKLEQEYGVSLFDRNKGLVKLTPAGLILQKHLQMASTLASQIVFDVSSFRQLDSLRGDLKLGASTTVALYIIPSVLSAFRKLHSEIHISMVNRNSENVTKALLNHEIDLAIVEGKNKMDGINSQFFLTEEVIAVCAPDSYLSKQSNYSIQELKTLPLAIRERGSGTLAAVAQSLQQHHLKISDLNICIRLGGTEVLKNFVMADDCMAFLPFTAVQKALERGDLVKLNIDQLNIQRHFYFIQRLGDENLGINKAFIKFAKNHYNI